jgi:hypothetical protein
MNYNTRVPPRWIKQDSPQAASLRRSTLTSLGLRFNGFLEWFGELGILSGRDAGGGKKSA